ncbi:DUF2147 domain-containing protein [Sphingobium aromaticivastans]|uniref:DUF2147 domain-containing protein n=1 Tax=Sphingobium aromaticivastans TaxID=1778665 RepID=UPI00301706FF
MGLIPISLLLLAGAAASPDIAGLWLTDDHKGVVRIEPCGPYLCGRVARILDRDPAVPRTDVNNPDSRLRNRPILGLTTLWGFSRAGQVWRGGRAYDPQTGKSYRSTLQLDADGSLKVTGCVLFICQSRRWTRVG